MLHCTAQSFQGEAEKERGGKAAAENGGGAEVGPGTESVLYTVPEVCPGGRERDGEGQEGTRPVLPGKTDFVLHTLYINVYF